MRHDPFEPTAPVPPVNYEQALGRAKAPRAKAARKSKAPRSESERHHLDPELFVAMLAASPLAGRIAPADARQQFLAHCENTETNWRHEWPRWVELKMSRIPVDFPPMPLDTVVPVPQHELPTVTWRKRLSQFAR